MATMKLNRIGLEPQIYKGGKTTLCAGTRFIKDIQNPHQLSTNLSS
jgi:hypothetical protein